MKLKINIKLLTKFFEGVAWEYSHRDKKWFLKSETRGKWRYVAQDNWDR
jgi:hypothetical protein